MSFRNLMMGSAQYFSNGIWIPITIQKSQMALRVRERARNKRLLSVDPLLQELVGIEKATLFQIQELVWMYVRFNDLRRPGNKVAVDERLRIVLKIDAEEIEPVTLMNLVMQHVEKNF